MFHFISDPAARMYHSTLVADRIMTDEQFIINEILEFKTSQSRREMLDGEKYYAGTHDILNRKREVIGENGDLEPVDNLPNNRIVDNQYKKMVDQKNNYLLGKPFTFQTKDKHYTTILKNIFNRRFMRTLKNIGEDSLNHGIGWMFVSYDDSGGLVLKRLKGFEVIPEWKDADHTVLDAAIRIHTVIVYDGITPKEVEKVEVFDQTGIYYFTLQSGKLTPEQPYFKPYITVSENGKELPYYWSKIPLIPFKSNDKEVPLIKRVKSLQDGINSIESNFQNNMEEDTRNTILILVNYDGQNLGEFRRNLAQYGAVKVRSDGSHGGDVRKLQVEVNSENYKSILEIFKKSLIENAMGYDAKDDRLSGNPNQLNILSMYSDIDLDADAMETEYQAAFEELLWFIDCHLYNTGIGDFESIPVEVVFNRNIMINESELIDNCNKSSSLLSESTVLSKHPWVQDPQKEMDTIKEEQKQTQEDNDPYQDAFLKDKAGDRPDEEP
ncbi:phage portal protein [Clostridium facile]|nr:phage portal protein [Clostridium facile]